MITFRCSCGKQLKVNDERAGAKVKCPQCEEILRVPEGGGIQEKPMPRKTRPMDDDEGIEDRPRRRARAGDEDEERPRRRAAGRYDDEDDDRGHRRRQKESGSGLMIGIIVGCVLLVAGGGVALFFLLKSDGGGRGPGGGPGPGGNGPQGPGKATLENNIRQLALAMHNFNDRYKRLPAPGFSMDPAKGETKPLLSWRVAILPFIEQENLYRQFKLNEPWDSPHNIKFLDVVIPVYHPVGAQPNKPGHTYIQFATGKGTLFPTPTSGAAIPRSFRDGTSNTILIVEAGEAVPWTKPADVVMDVSNVQQGILPKLGAFSPRGFYVGLGDGSMRFLDRSRVSDQTIRMAFNPADGNPMPPDW